MLYELRPDGTYSVLHSFAAAADGIMPSSIVQDSSGTIYGASYNQCDRRGDNDPAQNCGSIYSYVPSTGTFTVILTLHGYWEGTPVLIGGIDHQGTLFGASTYNGKLAHGLLFALRKVGTAYVFKVLHDFTGGADGGGPTLPYVNGHGEIVGTTMQGGTSATKNSRGNGTIYTNKNGMLNTLYSFTGGADGNVPNGSPFMLGETIYGTTELGGASSCTYSNGQVDPNGCGTVWRFTP